MLGCTWTRLSVLFVLGVVSLIKPSDFAGEFGQLCRESRQKEPE